MVGELCCLTEGKSSRPTPRKPLTRVEHSLPAGARPQRLVRGKIHRNLVYSRSLSLDGAPSTSSPPRPIVILASASTLHLSHSPDRAGCSIRPDAAVRATGIHRPDRARRARTPSARSIDEKRPMSRTTLHEQPPNNLHSARLEGVARQLRSVEQSVRHSARELSRARSKRDPAHLNPARRR